MLALWLVTTVAAPPTAEQARAILGRSVPDAIAEFQAWDLGVNGGKGNSDQTTSGELGWGESSFLSNYMHCFHATGDPYWLDKVRDHTDRILAGQHEFFVFRVWDDIRYSVGIVRVAGATGADGLSLTPAETRENVTRHGAAVTGHRFTIELPTAETVRVTDVTADKVVLDAAYPGKLVLDLFGARAAAPGDASLKDAAAPLTLSGPGRAGARFTIETLAPERIQFVVHDGMITYPIAQFIEAVGTDPALKAKYGAKADAYLAWFQRHVHDKWQPFWRQVDADSGAYTFTHQVTERFPGYVLPHNQFLALGRAYLVLQAVPGVANAAEYRRKAECMARYFQRHLRLTPDGAAYVWNYWDPPAGEEVRRYVEDYSHATIDVGFVVEAARRGVVFAPADAAKIARTYTDVMGNGDLEHPAVAGRVDGQGGFKERIWHDWCFTGLYDERAFAFAAKMAGGTATAWPELCDLAAALGAVTEDDRQACRRSSAELASAMTAAASGNRGFEGGVRGRPLGWSLDFWHGDKGEGRFEWSTDACEGQHSLALIGTGGSPNLVASGPPERVTGPTTLGIEVQYRTAGGAKPSLSLIAEVPGGERQYDNCPALAPSETWTTATWTATTKPGVTEARIYLRNSGVGTVWYDDLRVSR